GRLDGDLLACTTNRGTLRIDVVRAALARRWPLRRELLRGLDHQSEILRTRGVFKVNRRNVRPAGIDRDSVVPLLEECDPGSLPRVTNHHVVRLSPGKIVLRVDRTAEADRDNAEIR